MLADTIFGLLFLGCVTGIIPGVLLVILFKMLGIGAKAMRTSAQVLKEKEPPKIVKRNIKEELWDDEVR
jgi:hypothetical protein